MIRLSAPPCGAMRRKRVAAAQRRGAFRVTFTKAYEKRKRQILRAKGRPAGVKVLHGKRSRHVLRIGVVAALLAVVAMTSVFSNLNSKQDFAGLEIDMDNYLGVIAAPTTPDGFWWKIHTLI